MVLMNYFYHFFRTIPGVLTSVFPKLLFVWTTKKLWIRIEQALTLHQILKVAMNEFSGKILDLRKLEVISWVGETN